ncbi:septation ring formation regulator EzrA [Paenibacillus mucilaginosus]|uniref:hypothetical protein n=1 Tax=Paenibacillus mucilaginosus TaxID=61624 RepID=UPI003D214046
MGSHHKREVEKIEGQQNNLDRLIGDLHFTRVEIEELSRSSALPLAEVLKDVDAHVLSLGDPAPADDVMKASNRIEQAQAALHKTKKLIAELPELLKKTKNYPGAITHARVHIKDLMERNKLIHVEDEFDPFWELDAAAQQLPLLEEALQSGRLEEAEQLSAGISRRIGRTQEPVKHRVDLREDILKEYTRLANVMYDVSFDEEAVRDDLRKALAEFGMPNEAKVFAAYHEARELYAKLE